MVPTGKNRPPYKVGMNKHLKRAEPHGMTVACLLTLSPRKAEKPASPTAS